SIFETLAPISTWWTILHVAQIPLFALMGWAVLLLVRDLDGRSARITRVAIAVFIVVYPAFDAAVGVASGVIVHTVGTVDAGQRAALEAGVHRAFWGPLTGARGAGGGGGRFV